MADVVLAHPPGSSLNVVESEKVDTLFINLIVEDDDILRLGVDALNQSGRADKETNCIVIKSRNDVVSESTRNSSVMNANALPEGFDEMPIWMIVLRHPTGSFCRHMAVS